MTRSHNSNGEAVPFNSSIGPGSDCFQLLHPSDENEDFSQITMATKTMTTGRKRQESYGTALKKVVSSMQEALEAIEDVGHHQATTTTTSLLQSALALVLEAQRCQHSRRTSHAVVPPRLMDDTSLTKDRRIVMGKKLKFKHSMTNQYGSYYGTVNEKGKPDGHGTIIYTSMNTFNGIWHNGRRTIGTYVQRNDHKESKRDEPLVYQGQFADNGRNKFHGFGTMYVGRRCIWVGQMINGKVSNSRSFADSPTRNECKLGHLAMQQSLDRSSIKQASVEEDEDASDAIQQDDWDWDEFSILPSIVSARESVGDVVLVNLPSSAYRTDTG